MVVVVIVDDDDVPGVARSIAFVVAVFQFIAEHAHRLRSDAIAGVLQRGAARDGRRGRGEEGARPGRDHAKRAEGHSVSRRFVSGCPIVGMGPGCSPT